MEMKSNKKLAPKVKTLFHFAKKGNGSQIAPSDTTTTATLTHGTISISL